jgi:hypothetical protein
MIILNIMWLIMLLSNDCVEDDTVVVEDDVVEDDNVDNDT